MIRYLILIMKKFDIIKTNKSLNKKKEFQRIPDFIMYENLVFN